VTLDCLLSDAQCDLVADGLDLALRLGELPDSSLLAQSIAPVPAGLMASPDYLSRFGEPRHPRELETHRLLGYGHDNRKAPVRLIGPGNQAVSVNPRGPLFANNGELMLPLLVGGEGLAVLPHFIAREALRSGLLVPVMPDWQPPPLTLHLLTPPSRLRPGRVSALARLLVERLRNVEGFTGHDVANH
jgi:DNA-binding transcriptional LysR family regulator